MNKTVIYERKYLQQFIVSGIVCLFANFFRFSGDEWRNFQNDCRCKDEADHSGSLETQFDKIHLIKIAMDGIMRSLNISNLRKES